MDTKKKTAYAVPRLKKFSATVLTEAKERFEEALVSESENVKDEAAWKEFRDRWMARKNGLLTQINLLWLKGAPSEAKREVGQLVNRLKTEVENRVSAAKASVEGKILPSREESPAA